MIDAPLALAYPTAVGVRLTSGVCFKTERTFPDRFPMRRDVPPSSVALNSIRNGGRSFSSCSSCSFVEEFTARRIPYWQIRVAVPLTVIEVF